MSSVSAAIISPLPTSSPVTLDLTPAEQPTIRPVPPVERVKFLHDQPRSRQARPEPEKNPASPDQDEAQVVRGAVIPIGTAILQRDPAIARFATPQFLAQALAQDLGAPRHAVAGHRHGAVIGSDAYRRTGAEPQHYSEEPAIFRVAV